jgi:hypothetical protein
MNNEDQLTKLLGDQLTKLLGDIFGAKKTDKVIDHPDHPPVPNKWNIMVTDIGVKGCYCSTDSWWKAVYKLIETKFTWQGKEKKIELVWVPQS